MFFERKNETLSARPKEGRVVSGCRISLPLEGKVLNESEADEVETQPCSRLTPTSIKKRESHRKGDCGGIFAKANIPLLSAW